MIAKSRCHVRRKVRTGRSIASSAARRLRRGKDTGTVALSLVCRQLNSEGGGTLMNCSNMGRD